MSSIIVKSISLSELVPSTLSIPSTPSIPSIPSTPSIPSPSPTIIPVELDEKIGYYYRGIIPYVDKMKVSVNNNVFSLECDETFEPDKYIGNFYGYPGKFVFVDSTCQANCIIPNISIDMVHQSNPSNPSNQSNPSNPSNEKLFIGIGYASGIIFIDEKNFYEISEGIIKKGNYEEYNISDTKFWEKKSDNDSNNDSDSEEQVHKLKPQCTGIYCDINKNGELMIDSCHFNTEKNIASVGKFQGTPGEYCYDKKLKRFDRRFGNEHSIGKITLDNIYNFTYNYTREKISKYEINNKEIYRDICFMQCVK